MARYQLKQHIIVEPVINGWYAWLNLLSPLTFACYTKHHQALLASYLQSPEIHQEAGQHKKLRGGAFLDFKKDVALQAVDTLLQKTKSNEVLQALAVAIDQVNQLCAQCSTGAMSLIEQYPKVPAILQGLVELVYQANHQSYPRFIEPLVYASKCYQAEYQQVCLYEQDPDNRSFVLSTPRVEQPGQVWVDLPFASLFYDELFKMRTQSVTEQHLEDLYQRYLASSEISFDNFMSLFMEVAEVNVINQVDEAIEGINIQYVGHACVLVTTPNVTILVDPFVTYHKQDSDIKRISFADLPEKIDYVLITHGHQDHLMLETLLQIRYKIGAIIVPNNNSGMLFDPSLKLALNAAGFANVISLDMMEQEDIAGGCIQAIPFFGEHGDLDIRSKTAYRVTLDAKTMLFFADSKNISPSLYQYVQQDLPEIDYMFIGLESEGAPLSWLYGPLLEKPLTHKANQSRRLNGSNGEEAIGMVEIFQPKNVCIYAMGFEPWITFISNLDYESSLPQRQEAQKLVEYGVKKHIPVMVPYGSAVLTLCQ